MFYGLVGQDYPPADHQADLPDHGFHRTFCRLVTALRQVTGVSASVCEGLKKAVWWRFRFLSSKFEDSAGFSGIGLFCYNIFIYDILYVV